MYNFFITYEGLNVYSDQNVSETKLILDANTNKLLKFCIDKLDKNRYVIS